MKKPTLKIKLENGMQVIRCRKEDLDWDSGRSLAIYIPDFLGQTGEGDGNVIHIEWFGDRLNVRIYDGNSEAELMSLAPDPELTKAIYGPKKDLPLLLDSKNENVLEIVEKRLKEKR